MPRQLAWPLFVFVAVAIAVSVVVALAYKLQSPRGSFVVLAFNLPIFMNYYELVQGLQRDRGSRQRQRHEAEVSRSQSCHKSLELCYNLHLQQHREQAAGSSFIKR